MRVRHDNILHLAHFLCTKTEPPLYYKPWELGREEQDRIDDQIADARRIIQRERGEYEEHQENETRRERRATPDESTYRAAGASLDGRDMDVEPAQAHTGVDKGADDGGTGNQDQDMQDQHAIETADPSGDTSGIQEPAMDTQAPEVQEIADEPGKDADEEVVEAAEDTVIY